MQFFRTPSFLRRVLFADAATCIATGLLMMLGASLLTKLLGLPVGLLRYAGLSLLPFAAFLLYLAAREHLSSQMVWAVIILNALWAIDSLLLLLAGWVAPTKLGYAFVIAQALGVAVIAGLEYLGLRKSAVATIVPA